MPATYAILDSADQHLSVAVLPGGIRTELGVVFDSLNDDRSGFFFSTNPAGARRDLQIANDSQIN